MRDISEKIRGAFPMIAAHLREGGGESGLCRKLDVSRAELRRCSFFVAYNDVLNDAVGAQNTVIHTLPPYAARWKRTYTQPW